MAKKPRRDITVGYPREATEIRVAFPGGYVLIETDHHTADGGTQVLIGIHADQFPGEPQHELRTVEITGPGVRDSGPSMTVAVEAPAPKPVLVRYLHPRPIAPDSQTDDTQRMQHEYDRIANEMWREFEGGAFGPFEGEDVDEVGARFQEELDALEKGYTDKGYVFADERPGARESFTYSTRER